MNPKALVLCSALMATPTWAQLTYDMYEPMKDTKEMKNYLLGMIGGVMATHYAMKDETGKQLFCMPPTERVNTNTASAVLAAAAKMQPEFTGKAPLEMMYLNGLMHIFPCAKPAGQQ
ncbi:hypothetical protein [Hydrogenophaga sp. 2FB]|uniref:hypothetical protein n=1 Tax=Hydrogenophaga sp. 2FB TaxID=2502187 RepID=UPI0010F7B37C|nr:hypothetical protein [Hydrogenophaga sp. 2FB]